MTLNDAHCHFFSTHFYAALGRGLPDADPATPEKRALDTLAWEPPGTAYHLADRWVTELDRHHVSRAAMIASVPGDAESVGAAVRRHPTRLVGFFMVDPTQPAALVDAAAAIDHDNLRAMCLFPAMHRYALQDDHVRRLFAVAAARPGTSVFVHCGVLSVGVRKKLGLPSPFDIRFGNPLDLHALALAYPSVPIIIPHFGAGMLREALMVADLCPNILFDNNTATLDSAANWALDLSIRANGRLPARGCGCPALCSSSCSCGRNLAVPLKADARGPICQRACFTLVEQCGLAASQKNFREENHFESR